MLNLLANETKSLQSIQQLNVAAKRHDHAEKTQKLLEVMAKPYRWQLSNGQIAFVQTQATSHAASLLDLYNALQNTELITVDARLELLHHLKQVVHEGMHALGATSTRKHKSSSHLTLIQDIMDLADREADLLSRGRPPATLYSMRARLQNLLLQYIESPVFNSRAQEFVNLPKMSGTGNTLPMPAPPSPGK